MFVAPDIFAIVDHYIDELFAPEDEALLEAVAEAARAGLPPIQVSPNQGKLLYLFAKLIGAQRILEIGTLAGYSAIWLARALPQDGRLITLEADNRCADVAAGSIQRAGLTGKVEIIRGDARETLAAVIEKTDRPFDLVFLDADKVAYPFYYDLFMRRVRSGSLILADNVVRAGTVLAPRPDDPSAAAARRFNRLIAEDDRVEGVVLQQVGAKGHDGLAIARVR
jgi:predicted O-methyltransferase YrrM